MRPNRRLVETKLPFPAPCRLSGIVLLLILALLPALEAATFEITGTMNTVRAYHTATLLNSGSVLVAGGSAGGFPLGSAEIYHPTTGVWTVTNALITPRIFHSATKLLDGRVLVSGGYNGNGISHDSCEIFAPTIVGWFWFNTGALNQRRQYHTATLLADGRVLVAGGYSSSVGGYISSAELYDPDTGNWTATGSLATNRCHHSATLLPDGRVLVAGGNWDANFPLPSTEIYDPATGVWTPSGSMNSNREDYNAILLPNGKVLAAGGSGDSASDLYDPTTGLWTLTGHQNTYRRNQTATVLPGGKVLLAGGYANEALHGAEVYDSTTGTWTWTGAMVVPRYHHTATLLSNGLVLLAGGAGHDYLAASELFDPASASLPEGYNLISGQELASGNMRISLTGLSRWRYALQRTHNLSPADWQSLTTNQASPDGVLAFTNSPTPGTNNFWRVRAIP